MYGIIVVATVTFGVLFVTKKNVPAPVQVIFYTKAGCHLCEEARDMLEDIAALTTYELTEIDIRSDPAIFEKYRYRIPVITINGDTTIEGRIEFQDLAKAFHLR
jgi:glutaredoxin